MVIETAVQTVNWVKVFTWVGLIAFAFFEVIPVIIYWGNRIYRKIINDRKRSDYICCLFGSFILIVLIGIAFLIGRF